MKKTIYTLALALVSVTMVLAQVDRKQPPKPLQERTINFGKVDNFTLPNGLKVIVVENHKLPTVRVELSLDVTTIKEGEKAGYTQMFGEMMRAGTKNSTKEELDEKIDYLGSDFYTGNTTIYMSSLKGQLEPSMEIMKELIFNPTFSNQEELNKLKKQYKTGLEVGEKDPKTISERVKKVLLYSKEDAWGEYETEQTIDNISLSDFQNYYKTYFKPNIAYLTIVGDVTQAEAKQIAEKYFGTWEKGEVIENIPVLTKKRSGVNIAFVDLPTATQSTINIIGLADLKKTDKEYFSSVLGNSILGDGASGRLFKDIREKRAWTYGAYSSLLDNYKRSGSFGAYAQVRNEVTDSAVVEIIKNIKDITSKAPTVEELSLKKGEFNGNFALSLEKPETVARFVKTQFKENLSPDFYKNYLKSINGVTANQIPVDLKKVIDPDNLTILIVGKGEEVLPALEKTGYPINYYDKYGNVAEKPAGKKSAGNVTLENVLDKYYVAVAGSKEKVEALKTLVMEGDMKIPQVPTPIPTTIKFQSPNKMVTIMSLMGQTMKQGFDGTKGFSTMGVIPQDQIEEFKKQKGYFPELYYNNEDTMLDGLVSVEGKSAYKIIVKHGDNKKNIYYDVESGLKIKEEAATKEAPTVIEYLNYKEFGGYKLPTKTIISVSGQNMERNVKNYIINPVLSTVDFK